ncbi:calcium-binding protein 7 [Bos mutus]|uniref:calcium-binding protein 7 n=1 Tax=Bos mutus TaxID=72004 RepID=UPI0038B5B932
MADMLAGAQECMQYASLSKYTCTRELPSTCKLNEETPGNLSQGGSSGLSPSPYDVVVGGSDPHNSAGLGLRRRLHPSCLPPNVGLPEAVCAQLLARSCGCLSRPPLTTGSVVPATRGRCEHAWRGCRGLARRAQDPRAVSSLPPPGSTAASLACPELQGGSVVVDSWATRWLSLTRTSGSPEGEIREAFKVFDRDGNGFISKQELGTAMRSLGYMPNEVELEVIIQRLDMDGDGQVDFEEFVTLLGPKLSTSGIPEKFHGTDFDTVFWKCDMQKLTVDELKRLLYDTFCEHLSMKDIENIIMTEEESHLGTAEECPVDVETCSNQQIRQTCVRKSLICAFAIAFIISVMLIAANQVLRSGMK